MIVAIKLETLDKTGLKNLLASARRYGHDDYAQKVLRELQGRGWAERRDFDFLEWNQDKVKAALAPFVAVSETISDNRRTAYTEAGGRKIGRKQTDPDWMWIDTYTAMKAGGVNAVLVCHVPMPGDTPWFEVRLNEITQQRYDPAELDAALVRWKELAAEAAK